ncbi:MAG: ABC transporter ATP-binding protein [Synergistaceae bacterium]|nr:ABC transporter ATP-binding protein [Synergistaceae bacterium]
MNDILLRLEGVSRHFGGLKAVDDVSFSLARGEILGLIGPNGAGKTTCFNLISGVYAPTKGDIVLEGISTAGFPPYRMAALGVGRTFQVVKPFSTLSVLNNVQVALGLKRFGGVFSSLAPWDTKASRKEALEILEEVGIAHLAGTLSGQLPLGNQRRLELARALALKPKLLLLDETFSGLRHEEAAMLSKLVLGVRAGGISVLLIEHNMKVAMGLSDRLVVLDHGRLLAEGKPEAIRSDPRVVEAYLGKGASSHAS